MNGKRVVALLLVAAAAWVWISNLLPAFRGVSKDDRATFEAQVRQGLRWQAEVIEDVHRSTGRLPASLDGVDRIDPAYEYERLDSASFRLVLRAGRGRDVALTVQRGVVQ